MKEVFPKFLITVVLTVGIALLPACSDSVNSHPGPADGPAQSASPAPANAGSGTSSSSGYPKLASSIATAEIKGLDGATYTLNDKLGKVMLVNLWATWCGPCRSEIPALVRMQESLGPQGFEVLGLNTDDEELQAINDFSAELKINYTIAYANTNLQAAMLKVSKFPGIPQSFLIDRDGRLRGVFRGANPADVRKMEEVVAKVVNDSAGDVPADTPPTPAQEQPPAKVEDEPKPEATKSADKTGEQKKK